MVPFRPEGGQPQGKSRWREVKVGVLARLGQHRTRTGQVVTRLHSAGWWPSWGISMRSSRVCGLKRCVRASGSAPQVVWLSDGGRGLWRLFEEQFSGYATGVLDFYHAAQHLWKSAAAWLDGRTTQARRWFGWARHRLRHGHPRRGPGRLGRCLGGRGLARHGPGHGATVYAYLERHREHIDYAAYKALGLPLGSWDGGKRLQMAHPTTFQRGWDAVE